jgi:alcohol dehydrogenase class IV
LGGKYHVAHGLANAMLLPGVMKFNLESDIEKFRQIALAAGIKDGSSPEETARKGIERIAEIAVNCGIPQTLSAINVCKDDVEELSDLAMNVTRLLTNNPREVKREDAINIFNSMF